MNVFPCMTQTTGTVFLFCHPEDTASLTAFTRAAKEAGRQFVSLSDSQDLEPETLAAQSGRTALQVKASSMGYVDRYLDACPAGQQHFLLCAPEYDRTPNMSMIFHDFWEERKVAMDVLEASGPEA